MMIPASREYIAASFGPRAFAGLGAMTKAEAIAILGGAQQATATKAQMDEAYKAYYGPTGYYSQAPSVREAASYFDEGGAMAPPPSEMPAPMLYPAAPCGASEMMSTNCVAANAQVQQANLAIMENARRAYNLQHCEYAAKLNPGTAQDVPCAQFRVLVPVPAAPGVKQPAVMSGGQMYTPIAGAVSANEQLAAREAQQAAQREFQAQYTPSGVPRVPNQAVPPPPQAGEVPALDPGAGTGTGTGSGAGTGGGSAPALPFGLTANTLMIGAAALAAVFLLKGKG